MAKLQKEVEKKNRVYSVGRYWPYGTYWIIVNWKRNSIWKQTYITYEEAQKEFDLQILRLKPGQTHNFVIEVRIPNESYHTTEGNFNAKESGDTEFDLFVSEATEKV